MTFASKLLRIVHHPDYQAPIQARHRFPMSKYGYLREQLIETGLMAENGFERPAQASAAMLSRAHDPAYVERAFALTLSDVEMKRIGLPRTERVIRRARLASAGTALAADLALDVGIACNTAGGSHHAGPDGGAGFSTFNDVAAAAHLMLARGRVRRVLVFDCDVHQGDGTARIFTSDDRVVTVSMHAGKNYPFEKARSDLDVPLEDALGDDAYLEALDATLAAALARGPFDLVFYNAGVDVHVDDRLGRLALSDQGLAARERMALESFHAAGLPIVTVLGGGYGDDPRVIAARHVNVFNAAAEIAAR